MDISYLLVKVFFKRFYLYQQKEIPTFTQRSSIFPDEVFNTYVEFLEDLHIDTYTYNILIQQVSSCI